MTLTDDELKSARELANAATPGPWLTPDRPRLQGAVTALIGERDRQVASIDGDAAQFDMRMGNVEVQHANAAFIAAARTLVPRLLDEVERLRKEVARWEALGERRDIKLREVGCQCHREKGDSPCDVHNESED